MKHYIILLFFLLLPIAGHSLTHRLFTTDQHLSSSLINNLYEDSKGMIWIATEDGLNRYDGAKFTIYKHIPNDSTSLAHNYVSCIFEDSHGNLLVGSYGGLQLYDRATDSFISRAIYEDGKTFYSSVKCMVERANGEIWITGDHLLSVTIKDKQPRIRHLEIGIPTDMTEYIMEDQANSVWLSRGKYGIYQIQSDGTVHHYQSNQETDASIISLCKDINGNIYAGSTEKGLLILDKEKKQFTSIPYKDNKKYPMKSLYTPDNTHIYICTDGKGMKVYDIHTRKITDYTIQSNFDSDILKVHYAMQDHAGNLWLALYQKGVAMIPSNASSFNYIGYKSTKDNVIGSSCITSIFRSHNGNLWIGTDNEGIYRLNSHNRLLTHYSPSENVQSIPAIIVKLYEDSENTLWFGSYTSGLGRIDPSNGQCTFQQDLLDRQGKKVQHIYDIVEDNEKRLWIATFGQGLYCYDMKSRKTLYDSQANHKMNQWICCLHHSSDNRLYIGTYAGLYMLDLNQGTQAINILSRRIILNIYEDSKGNIWTGGSDGLTSWNPQTQEFQTYSTENGLPSNTVYAIQEDSLGDLWISTNSGISNFDTNTKEFSNYYVGDGLQGNEFTKNSVWKDANGTIWFGGVNGITYFQPQDISSTSKKWNIRITGFHLPNTIVKKGTLSNGKPIINESVYEANEFHLSYNDNTFSIEFAPLEYNAPERLIYACSINDKDWVYLPNGINLYSFYNMDPGTYRFRVKAIDNGLSSDIREITIHISPVWWASGWAKLIYVLLLVIFITFIISQVKARHRAKLEMQQHIYAEEIKDAKLQFFTHISHEIRTPISFIINPLQKLMKMENDNERKKMYHTIHLNSERILRLINQLMDVQKIDQGKMRLTFQETELVEIINDICDIFKEEAKNLDLEFNFHHEGLDELKIWIDPIHFDKIIPNLLSNAFKFTPKGGKVDIRLSKNTDTSIQGPLRDYAEIIVSDTGKGIDEKEKEQIFQAFYQAANNTNAIGTGIGLHLTHSLVELHHGTITCQNNSDGPGCRFIVQIPLGNSHLQPEEMLQENNTVMPAKRDISTSYLNIEEEKELVPAEGVTNNKHYILIVEDNEEIRHYLTLELSPRYHIKGCSNGKEALEEIFHKEPDLVISDVMMPEMDGFTLCRKIKSNINLNHIPIILLTAKVQEEDRIEALERGADAYLTKPFNSNVLEKTITNLILSRERLKNTFSGQQSQEDKMEKLEVESPDDKLMARIMKVINSNLSNPALTSDMIAIEVGTSRVHLNRKMRELTNQSTREFIRNCRLKQAAVLLSEKKHNITEIAELTGFTNPNNFSTAFKELFGVPPSAYKEHIDTQKDHEDNQI